MTTTKTQTQTTTNQNSLLKNHSMFGKLKDQSILECRYYEKKYPEEGQLVMFIASQITEHGILGKLPEFNNIESLISKTEVSSGRANSFYKYFRPGKYQACLVLRVDEEKGYIDLSRKRVNNPVELEVFRRFFRKSQLVHFIMKKVAKESVKALKTLYKQIVWPLYHRSVHPFDAFRKFLSDPTVLDNFNLGNIKKILKKVIKQKMPLRLIKVEAVFEMTCFNYDGIEAIKKSLTVAEQMGTNEHPIEVFLITAPIFRVCTTTFDHEYGLETLKQACNGMAEMIQNFGGSFQITRPPRALLNEKKHLNNKNNSSNN
ncbi:eukaryotic translation initiation factor 2 subunit 1 [Anaeramoeba flamelloides]|uniref:Eukaryotic translation initiation factor 2 subunit 1 n=1 Tax=Anaeramoeba flamelloides TaxID=1746091 RepID=A0ABQ8YGY8_9EUKA|nr:eukaryotic translation initiation factor 2 subunit 1 [Anaeramoeba flamelloides]